MRKNIIITLLLTLPTLSAMAQKDVRTFFQTHFEWRPTIDVRTDAALVYGAEGDLTDFNERVQSWRDRGYEVQFMTSSAWGGRYADYFTGKWDGRQHFDLVQMSQHGDSIWHGSYPNPYVVPTLGYLEYVKASQLKRAIDAGINTIYLEEPEFWAYAGYSEAFKKEWQEYYGFPWRPQHLSAENTYLSNKLKYHLYYRALDSLFTYAKRYGQSLGRDIKCYLATHTLLNYSNWLIVSPEASVASMKSCDGYIAQVWTGTSRTPNFFNGVIKERTFENAFLEYGCMISMTAPTGRRVYCLTDPIEDNPHDWGDYKHGYEATFTAELLYPRHNYYQVMPWPARIYEGTFHKSATDTTSIPLPRTYSTQMQVMVNALEQMPLTDNKVSGSEGINVLMSNSLMFQRKPGGVDPFKDPAGASPEDPALADFYGLAMPLLMRGVPVGISHLENVGYAKAWNGVRTLLMTYSNMKPLDPTAHKHIADWVRRGGKLIYCSRDTDAYQTVKEWWNQGDMHYGKPVEHLFQLMGIANATEGVHHVGKGSVTIIRKDPKEFVLTPGSDGQLLKAVEQAYGPVEYKNYLSLRRGPYVVASVIDDDIVSDKPLVLKGKFIDLFDPTLPFLTEKTLHKGEQGFLYDLEQVKHTDRPQVIAAASRQYDERVTRSSISFVSKSPKYTTNRMVVLLPSKAKSARVTVTDAQGNRMKSKVQLLQQTAAATGSRSTAKQRLYWANLEFENDPDGVHVTINYQ